VTKAEKTRNRTGIATTWIIANYDRHPEQMSAAELIAAMLAFNENHASWKTICHAGASLGVARLSRPGDDAATKEQIHRAFQKKFGEHNYGLVERLDDGFYALVRHDLTVAA
jgi:hypothetical protein